MSEGARAARGCWQWRARRRCVLAGCSGDALRLAELHSRGWIHGDVSPASFVPASGEARVLLVDSARATRADAPPQCATEVDGPLFYLAPERTGRMQIPFDHRADLYSLGATFYERSRARLRSCRATQRVLHGHVAIVPPAPRERVANIPAMLSDIVMRLLEKMPECRYQTASAVVDDLHEVANRLRASGEVGEFELGRTDPGRRLGTPRALYGREAEMRALRDALGRCREGAHELALITGPSGIGKSALAHHALSEHPWVGSSRFDALGASRPYGMLADAVRGLIGRLIEAPIALRARIATRARNAVGGDGRALLGLLPDLQRLTGTLPPLAQIDVSEGDPRTRMVLRALIRALAAADAPIVLSLDDLHLADAATIDLVGSLVSDDGVSHLLVAGTFRRDSLSHEHPLARLRRYRTGSELSVRPRSCQARGPLAARRHAARADPPLDRLSSARRHRRPEHGRSAIRSGRPPGPRGGAASRPRGAYSPRRPVSGSRTARDEVFRFRRRVRVLSQCDRALARGRAADAASALPRAAVRRDRARVPRRRSRRRRSNRPRVVRATRRSAL
jgi:AAA ATPase domain